MSVLHKQPSFNNVVAGSTAVLSNLDKGDSCIGLIFKLGGTFTKAQIENLRVNLGGKRIVDITGSHLDDVNDYMKRTANANYLALYFGDPNARTITGEQMGAIDTSIGYSNFAVEVDIAAAAISPTLECWMIKGRPKPDASPYKRMFRAMLKAQSAPGGSGTFSLPVPLGSDSGSVLARLHMFHANITQVDVKKNGLAIQDNGENALVQFMQNELRRTTQAGMLVFDPMVNDNQSEAISTLKPNGQPANMSFDATLSAADTVTMYSELYTTIDRI